MKSAPVHTRRPTRYRRSSWAAPLVAPRVTEIEQQEQLCDEENDAEGNAEPRKHDEEVVGNRKGQDQQRQQGDGFVTDVRLVKRCPAKQR